MLHHKHLDLRHRFLLLFPLGRTIKSKTKHYYKPRDLQYYFPVSLKKQYYILPSQEPPQTNYQLQYVFFTTVDSATLMDYNLFKDLVFL